MRERPQATAARPGQRRATFSVDVVLITPRGKQLAVLLVRADETRTRERWWVPHDEPQADESMIDAARRIATEAAQVEPTWLEQIGAFGDGRRHPTETDLSVAYVGVVPQGAPMPANDDSAWFALADIPALTPRQRGVFDAALEAIRLDSTKRRLLFVCCRRLSRSVNYSRPTSSCLDGDCTRQASAGLCRRHGWSSRPMSGAAKVVAVRRSCSDLHLGGVEASVAA